MSTLTKSLSGINIFLMLFSNYYYKQIILFDYAPVILKFFPLTGLTVRKGLIAEENHILTHYSLYRLRDDFYRK